MRPSLTLFTTWIITVALWACGLDVGGWWTGLIG